MERPSTSPPRPPELRRSSSNRVLAGVAGGLGEYLNLDPILIRIGFVVLTFLGGPGILLYVVAWIVIPEAAGPPADRPDRAAPGSGERTSLLIGAALIAIGGFMLVDRFIPELNRIMWPLSLILVGLLLLYQGSRR